MVCLFVCSSMSLLEKKIIKSNSLFIVFVAYSPSVRKYLRNCWFISTVCTHTSLSIVERCFIMDCKDVMAKHSKVNVCLFQVQVSCDYYSGSSYKTWNGMEQSISLFLVLLFQRYFCSILGTKAFIYIWAMPVEEEKRKLMNKSKFSS